MICENTCICKGGCTTVCFQLGYAQGKLFTQDLSLKCKSNSPKCKLVISENLCNSHSEVLNCLGFPQVYNKLMKHSF